MATGSWRGAAYSRSLPSALPSAAVVIPTLDARELLGRTLESLRAQTVPVAVTVVDNASRDDTAEMVRRRFPEVRLVRNTRNLGFGRAIGRGAEGLAADVLVLVNNDVICEPDFVEHILAPFADPSVGMVAGVLTQLRAPGRIDTAGIALDTTLGARDHLGDRPVTALAGAPAPAGPCGGAAAYRMTAFRAAGGFDPAIFAYWEDVDLALELHRLGWRCALAPGARAEHHHGATLGAGSPRQRELEAFGRAFVLAKHGVVARRPLTMAKVALRDWPGLLVHLVVRRETAPLRARRAGARAGRARRRPGAPPLHLATAGVGATLAGQAAFLVRRLRGRLPAHYSERSGSASPP